MRRVPELWVLAERAVAIARQREQLEMLRFSSPMSHQVNRALAWAARRAAQSQSTTSPWTAADAYAMALAHLLAGEELDGDDLWGAPSRGCVTIAADRRWTVPPAQGNRHERRAEASRRRRQC